MVLSMALEHLPVGLAFVDCEYKYRFNTSIYQEWFKTPVEDIYGKYVWDVIGHDAFKVAKPYLDRALSGDCDVSFERPMPYLSGIRWVNVCLNPHVADFEVVGVWAAVIDVTAKHNRVQKNINRIQESTKRMLHHLDNCKRGVA